MKDISIPVVARVEGHGGVYVSLDENNNVKQVEFRIFEGSRFFEAFLIGKRIEYVPSISSRICGICGPVHAVSSVKAIEDALGIELPENVKFLRKMVVVLNTIESNLLHIVALSLPDYYNVNSLIELPSNIKSKALKVLRLREYIGKLLDILCANRIHVRNIVPGGFTKLPLKDKVNAILREVQEYTKTLYDFTDEVLEKMLIDYERQSHYVALYNGREYALEDGDLKVDSVLQIPVHAYRKYFTETTINYSTAKKSLIYGVENYMVGALARLNTNTRFIRDHVKDLIRKYNIKIPSTNPFLIPVAQLLESISLIDDVLEQMPAAKYHPTRTDYSIKRGIGVGIVEAPRGILYHCYVVGSNGRLQAVDVVTPTAQNVADIEDSIIRIVSANKNLDEKHVKRLIENIVRTYDPCISCSVHIVYKK